MPNTVDHIKQPEPRAHSNLGTRRQRLWLYRSQHPLLSMVSGVEMHRTLTGRRGFVVEIHETSALNAKVTGFAVGNIKQTYTASDL
jgi:hypothetical protein